jgi:hypothetical protein
LVFTTMAAILVALESEPPVVMSADQLPLGWMMLNGCPHVGLVTQP